MAERINTVKELHARIELLRARKELQEARVVASSRAIYATITDPAPIIKKCVRDLVTDKDFGFDLLRLGLSWWNSRKSASQSNNNDGGEKGSSFGASILGKIKDFLIAQLK